MKYVFELYEFGKRGRIFLGYKSVVASSSEEAREMIKSKIDENVVLAQIYIPQEL